MHTEVLYLVIRKNSTISTKRKGTNIKGGMVTSIKTETSKA